MTTDRYSVKHSPEARQQLAAIADYITSEGEPERAIAYVARIVGFCDGLALFPRRGRRRDDLLEGMYTTGFERRVTITYTIANGGTDDISNLHPLCYQCQLLKGARVPACGPTPGATINDHVRAGFLVWPLSSLLTALPNVPPLRPGFRHSGMPPACITFAACCRS